MQHENAVSSYNKLGFYEEDTAFFSSSFEEKFLFGWFEEESKFDLIDLILQAAWRYGFLLIL